MDWFAAPDYWFARLVLERGLAAVYLLAFANALHQFPALLGERGLLPVPRYLAQTRFRDAPSLFHFGYSDRLLRLVGWTGVVLAAATLLGLPAAAPLWTSVLVWLVLWAFYLSIVNVGQRFYSFGWESLLLEAGFLAVFLGNARMPPPLPILLLFRWLALRVELGAGLIKLRGDRCWRDLTCLDYHHETQPMPNPLSWFAHRMPSWFHRLEVLGNYLAQLAAPAALLLPQPIAGIGAVVMIATQAYLMLSGNYAFLNLVTLVVASSALPDGFVGGLAPVSQHPFAAPTWFVGAAATLTALVVLLSYWPVRNLFGRHQLMNFSFNRLHLVNTYGAFGSITRRRKEVVLEGAGAERPREEDWREYEFFGKPGDPRRRPPQIAPYHLRLDWLMWFVALAPAYGDGWLLPLLRRLLEGDRATLRLLRYNPFPAAPPRWVRARLYRYRFSTRDERRATGAWWIREPAGILVGPLALRPADAAADVGSGVK
ncbi:MAG TPA: lipase maturation factor family protein [Gemmatimonadales bacterium]|nr:lipase maturation factor family protein [Gemmatimonadales bacterium]